MKINRVATTFTLMISSILLLLVLQAFWLRSSYERAYFDLRRETSGLFRSTVFALRDTFFFKRMEPLTPNRKHRDSVKVLFSQASDSAKAMWSGRRMQLREQASSLQIFISSTPDVDSIQSVVRPLISSLHEGQIKNGSNFIVRVNLDSLHVDSVQTRFEAELKRVGIAATPAVKHVRLQYPSPPDMAFGFIRPREAEGDSLQRAHLFSDTLHSEWVRFDPVHRYAVALTGVRSILLQQITPQILFSAFLTLITCTAFFLMHRSLRAQQKLMALKNDFISNITHELKTPVTTVSVALEALRNFRGLENPKLTEEYLEIAQSELNRLAILTDKVLKTAIFENKGVSFQPEPVDMEKLINQILNSMRLLFEKQKATVTFEKRGENFVVAGGGVHLTNVIYNLLDNALKYSPGEPKINISLINGEHQIEILVKDEGIGIPAEFRKKIFEKFFRVPTGDVHNTKGYGLGLSYVDSVIRSHHGSIEVLSNEGPGSLFRIVLPK